MHLELGALSRRESRELLGGDMADGDRGALLYEESGGNPFYLEQLARARASRAGPCAARPVISPAHGHRAPTRRRRRADRGARAAATTARRVLEGAAVAGDPFEPELAAAASSTSDAATLDALDELLRVDLVRSTDVPRRFRFRHPLVRRAVYESTPGAWRLGAHERSADALAARGAERDGAGAPRRAVGARGRLLRRRAPAARPARRLARARPRAQRAGSQGRCACSRTMRRPQQRVELLLARAARARRPRAASRESHAALLASLRSLQPDAASSCG